MEKMITIPEREYQILVEASKVDQELLIKLIRGLEDVKEGRIKEWIKPKKD